MIEKLNKFITVFSSLVSPIINLLAPIYKKLILPHQKALCFNVLHKCAPFLAISANEKKKILENNLVGKGRAVSVFACFIQAFWTSSATLSASSFGIATFIAFLIFKGYRFAYVLAGLFVIFDFFLLGFYTNPSVLLLILWLVVALVLLAYSFKYENARITLEDGLELKRSHPLLINDFVAAVVYSFMVWVIAVIVLAVVSFFYPKTSSTPSIPDNPLNSVAGIAARHIYGYADYCKSQGYELTRYPDAFSKHFNTAVAKIQNQLADEGNTLANFYSEAKKVFGERLLDSIAKDIDKVRRQAIIESVAQQNNLPPEQVAWSDDFNQVISPEEGCVIFDEMTDSILASNSADFEKLKNF